jgi:type II secretory pathway pseudopilin PulG
MKLDKQDWHQLQLPLIILMGVVVLIAASLFFVQNYSLKQASALQTQQNLLNAARQRYQLSGMEKETISEYLPQYQALINKGFVGEERRIEWVEALREQHKSNKLFGIKYSISQQEDFRPSFAPNLGGFVLHRSIMKLDLDMLHEGDILQLTESLSAKNTAPFMLRDCELTRLNSGGALSKQLIANLHAQCQLDWLTAREPAPVDSIATVQMAPQ